MLRSRYRYTLLSALVGSPNVEYTRDCLSLFFSEFSIRLSILFLFSLILRSHYLISNRNFSFYSFNANYSFCLLSLKTKNYFFSCLHSSYPIDVLLLGTCWGGGDFSLSYFYFFVAASLCLTASSWM